MSIYSPETDIVDQSLTTRLMDYCELNFKRLAEENKKLRYFLHEAELHQEESDKTIITFRREVEQLGYDIINMADILARTGRPSPNDSHEDVIILADILATHYLHSTANQAINKLLIQRRRSAEV